MKKLLLAGPVVIGAVVLGGIVGLLTAKIWFNFYIITSIFPDFIRVPLSNFYPETLLPILIGAILGAFLVFILSALGIITILVTSKKTLIGKR